MTQTQTHNYLFRPFYNNKSNTCTNLLNNNIYIAYKMILIVLYKVWETHIKTDFCRYHMSHRTIMVIYHS